jgi:hypothetical protein
MRLMHSRLTLAAGLAASVALGACDDSNSPSNSVVDLISCAPSTTGGDNLTRGFYVDSFPGSTLKSVTSYFTATGGGVRTIALTAHDGTFDGSVIGTDTIDITAADADTNVAATFDLGNNSVTTGSTVAFGYSVIADTGGVLFMETATTNISCPVTQTEATTTPLDTDRRSGLPMIIRGRQ